MLALIGVAIVIAAATAVSMQPYNLVGDPWHVRLRRRLRRRP